MKQWIIIAIFYVAQVLADNKCGTTYGNSACGTLCPFGTDGECNTGIGERCWADAPPCSNSPVSSSTPKCGTSYGSSGCGQTCPAGIDSQCPSGQRCWADPPLCGGGPTPTAYPSNFPTPYPQQGPSPTPPPVSGGSNCVVGQVSGRCQSVSSCNGISVSGYCSGSSSNQCCVLEPNGNTVMHVPNAPSTGSSLGTCRSLQDGFSGNCIPTSDCTGATFNDVCPGGSSYKCCVRETEPVPDLLRDPTMSSQVRNLFLLDFSTFRSLFTGISSTRAQGLFPYYNYAIAEVLLDARSQSESCYRSAAFAAQIGHESVGLLYFEEIASGAAYEGREDLGNTQPGDGPRFKGRGPIQLTGRYNYESAGSRLGENLEADPDRVCFPNMGFLTTVDYWMSRNLNRYAGTASESDFITLTRLINGGTNGLTDRQNRWYAARRQLGCDGLRAAEEAASSKKGSDASILIGGCLLIISGVFLSCFLKRMVTRKRNRTDNDTPPERQTVEEVPAGQLATMGGNGKDMRAQNPMFA